MNYIHHPGMEIYSNIKYSSLIGLQPKTSAAKPISQHILHTRITHHSHHTHARMHEHTQTSQHTPHTRSTHRPPTTHDTYVCSISHTNTCSTHHRYILCQTGNTTAVRCSGTNVVLAQTPAPATIFLSPKYSQTKAITRTTFDEVPH